MPQRIMVTDRNSGEMTVYQWQSKVLLLGVPSELLERKYSLKCGAFIPLASY